MPSFGGFGGGAFGVSLGYGTLGKTLEPSWRFGGLFGLRAPIGLGQLEGDLEEGSAGLDFGGSAHIGGAGLLADFYPLTQGPRLTAGMMLTDMGAELAGETVEVGGVDRQVLPG